MAIPATAGRPFDYAVPPPLAGRLRPGTPVRVPFRSRTATGFVVALAAESEVPRERLRPLLEIDPATLPVAPPVVELCRWAAAYYRCGLGDLLKAALPPAAARGRRTAWIEALPFDPEALPPRRRALWAALRESGPLPVAEAVRRLATTRPTLRALAAAGAARWEEREGEGEAAPVEAAEGRRPALTPEQAAALEALRTALGEAAPRPVLLHGVT
ncbi:MAG: hypothetical protein D6739_10985, partial [Nitrospirae bacterium]